LDVPSVPQRQKFSILMLRLFAVDDDDDGDDDDDDYHYYYCIINTF